MEQHFLFLYPYLLYIGIPVTLLAGAGLYVWSRKARRRRLSQFTTFEETDEMLRSGQEHRRMLRHGLVLLGLIFILTALARPMTGPKEGSDEGTGVDVLLAIDISKSMLAGDMKPYRLEVVKEAIREWLGTLVGDRVGIILFAGDGFLQIPLTSDLVSVEKLLDAANPRTIRKGGSNIELGIQIAIEAYERDTRSSRAVVVFSDGEHLDDEPVMKAGEAFREHKIRVYTVGVGTTEGAIVPQNWNAEKKTLDGAVRNEYGATVRTRINPVKLRAIANAGGGAYFSLVDNPEALKDLHRLHLSQLTRESREINADSYDEWFQIPLFLGLVLLFLEPLLQNLKSRQNKTAPATNAMSPQANPKSLAKPRPAPAAAILTLALAAGLGLSPSPSAQAAEGEDRLLVRYDQQRLATGEEKAALESLRKRSKENPNDAEALYNFGVGLYANGQHREAAAVFEQVANMPDTKIRPKALFQLANAGVRAGEVLVRKKDFAAGTLELERALGIYDQLEKDDRRAKKNLKAAEEVYLALLEQLADDLLKGAEAEKEKYNVPGERTRLERAIGALEKMIERQPEHGSAQPKLEQARKKLADNLLKSAKEQRDKAETAFAGKKPEAANKPMQTAVDIAHDAVALDPESKKAETFLKETQERFSEMLTEQAKTQMAEGKADQEKKDNKNFQFNKFQQAMNTAQQAVDMDNQNKEAKDVLEQAKSAAEKAAIEGGDEMVAQSEKAKDATGEALALNGALEKYEDALGINEENQHAKDQIEKLEPKLADALTQMGKEELAKAQDAAGKAPDEPKPSQGSEPGAPKPSSPGAPKPSAPGAGEPSMAEVRESLNHLSKADQALSQAMAFGAEEQEIKPVMDQVEALSTELQTQMDALAAAQDAAAQDGQPGEPSPEAAPGKPSDKPAKQRSFADIRDYKAPGDYAVSPGGSKTGFVKDW